MESLGRVQNTLEGWENPAGGPTIDPDCLPRRAGRELFAGERGILGVSRRAWGGKNRPPGESRVFIVDQVEKRMDMSLSVA
jgi:hypothetical protein